MLFGALADVDGAVLDALDVLLLAPLSFRLLLRDSPLSFVLALLTGELARDDGWLLLPAPSLFEVDVFPLDVDAVWRSPSRSSRFMPGSADAAAFDSFQVS